MSEENIFRDKDKGFERRSHGCDGCRENTSTERFDGYCGGHLWLCKDCYKKVVSKGLNAKGEKDEQN